jgi:hypothetical protein
MNKKLLLISGCPRSGTTLLNIILNSHPEVAITNEVNLYNIAINLDDKLFNREKKIEKMILLNKNINRKQTARETWKAEDLLNWIPRKSKCKNDIIYKLCSSIKSSQISVYGDKTPTYYHNDISKMAKELDLTIYMIHVSRDPFEVVSSIDRRIKNSQKNKDYWKAFSNIEDAINEWIIAWNSRKVFSENNNIKFLDFNYNAFIKKPTKGVDIISKFLSVENKFDIDMVNQFDLDHTIEKKKIIKKAPQLEKILNLWSHFDIVLDGNYQEIEILKHSFFVRTKKDIIKKLKFFKKIKSLILN